MPQHRGPFDCGSRRCAPEPSLRMTPQVRLETLPVGTPDDKSGIRPHHRHTPMMKGRKPRSASKSLSATQFRAITKAISDPRRYDILQHIAGQRNCTCVELRECSPITAATLSHHLKELESAGLISIARKGKFALPCFRREVWKTYLAQLAEL